MLKCLAIIALLLSTTAVFSEQRAALVIGNDNYDHLPDLTKAVNDARAMGTAFSDLGYDVTTGTDLNLKSLSAIVQKFSASLSKDSTAVVYVASHGLSVAGTQYFVPIDVSESAAKLLEELLASSVNFDGFLEELGKSKASNLVVIFDSCRNNPFQKATRSLSQVSDYKKNIALMFSSAPGACPFESVNSADTSPTSPFVRFLVEELKNPGVTLAAINSKIRLRLFETGLDQQPWYQESSTSEIILNPNRQAESLPTQFLCGSKTATQFSASI